MIVGTAVQTLLAFGGNLIMLQALEPAEFGRFAVSLASVTLIIGLLSLRLGLVIIRTPEAEFTSALQSRYFTALLCESALITIIATLWLALSGRTSLLEFVLLSAVVTQNFCAQNRAFWERKMAFGMMAFTETLIAFVGQAVGVAVVLATGSAAALYIREAAIALAMLAVLRLVGEPIFKPLARPDFGVWSQVLRDSRGVWLDSILEGLFQRATLFAAAALGGDRGAGLFAMAQRLAILPHQILQPLCRIAANWFSRTAELHDRRTTRDQLLVVVAAASTAAAIVMIAVADPLVPWLFGEHWRDAAEPLIFMSGVIVFMTAYEITRYYALVGRQTPILLRGRAAQFGAFGLLAAVAASSSTPLIYLSSGLSLAFMFAFASQFLTMRRQGL